MDTNTLNGVKEEEIAAEIDNDPEKFLPTFNPFQICKILITILISIFTFTFIQLNIFLVVSLLASYGWWIIGITILGIWVYNKSKPSIKKWKIAQEDAEYHKSKISMISFFMTLNICD